MPAVKSVFDPGRQIARRIEKVITYDTTNEELLRQEVTEYVATDSIEEHFSQLLDRFDEGMSGGSNPEIGVWVSGFYGSGKSSFTKYLGFAFDPTRVLDGQPFLEYLKNRFRSQAVKARLTTVAKKHPAAVIMLDLASEMLAGATMAEISSVLYAKVMQWAGYSRDAKIAYLEFMLESEGKLDAFKQRVGELSKGKHWDEIKNQPLVMKALAAKVAVEFYPDIFEDTKAFNDIRIEDRIKEDERVKQMLDLIEKKTGTKNIIFVLDEVGQYVAARDDLILNLDGLAKNVKRLGLGHVWIIATAQQTLTEDDPRAATNTAKLFKLKDRFPVNIDLEASDIKEICYSRLLGKSSEGEQALHKLFESSGSQLRHAVALKNTKLYKADLNKETFCKYYPFLPHHFDILLELLAKLAKTRGGVGLRSAIKVIQDILIDPSGARRDGRLLAEEPLGTLASTVLIYDTLRADIERPFPHIVNGVNKVQAAFGAGSVHVDAAKSVAVLQILEDFPVSRDNVAALMHPSVDSASMADNVSDAVKEILDEKDIPLTEVDGSLRFMSEAVLDLEKEKQKIIVKTADIRNIRNSVLKEVFTPAPSVRLHGSRTVTTGFKVRIGSMPVSLLGDREPIQTVVLFADSSTYEATKNELILESQQHTARKTIYLLGHEDTALDTMAMEICRCREVHKAHGRAAADKEVEEYVRAQKQRADQLEREMNAKLKKALHSGSFIFTGTPRSVGELSDEVTESVKKQLETVADAVFSKYMEAPVSAESAAAERFLNTDDLSRVAKKDDPLDLVKGGRINDQHPAVISVKNYLEKHGQVDGRKLLDDLYNDPYGWSKDTVRYLVAAMLVAGIIKLRVGREDVTVRGDLAKSNLKNTNSFNKVGVALRDNPPDPQALMRAVQRLLTLTGEQTLPLEAKISECVVKHFPGFQQDYAPIATQLENLGLEGVERARGVLQGLAAVLLGDASDATTRLGGEECPLFDDLCWIRDVAKAFKAGAGTIIGQANRFKDAIPRLPGFGIPGELVEETAGQLETLTDILKREDFYTHTAELQQTVAAVETAVAKAVKQFVAELQADLQKRIAEIQSMHEWGLLGTADKERLGAELETLSYEAKPTLDGLTELLGSQYNVNGNLERIRQEVLNLAKPGGDDGTGDGAVDMEIPAPRMISTVEELDQLIEQIETLRTTIAEGTKIRITWK